MHVAVNAENESVDRHVIKKVLKENEKDKRVYGTGFVGPDFLVADFVFQP